MAHTLNAPQPNHSNQVEIYRLGNESKTHSANLIALNRKVDGGLASWTVVNLESRQSFCGITILTCIKIRMQRPGIASPASWPSRAIDTTSDPKASWV